MNIHVADERIVFFKELLSQEEAKQKAWEKKVDAFGALNKVASFLSRPKDEDFELVYQEHRYEPFWRVAATAHYVYDRKTSYQVNVTGKEVQSVTFESTDFPQTNGHIHIPVVEHCVQDLKEDICIDGLTGEKQSRFEKYLTETSKEVPAKEIETFVEKNAIVVPPKSRVSGIMREILARMIQGIQADTIFEENVDVTTVDLCYHPVYAFEYRWISKQKQAIIEIDAVTGQVSTGNKFFKEYLGKVLDRDFLFDIGADTAGMFIPGGSIAVKVAKKYIESKK